MSAATETYAARKRAETAALLQDIVDAGGTVAVRFDKAKGARLAVRFDLIETQDAVRLFIAYRTARPRALQAAALAMLQGAMESTP